MISLLPPFSTAAEAMACASLPAAGALADLAAARLRAGLPVAGDPLGASVALRSSRPAPRAAATTVAAAGDFSTCSVEFSDLLLQSTALWPLLQ